MSDQRIERCIVEMEKRHIDQLIVSTAVNLFYFTGSWVESGERLMTLILSRKEAPKLLIHQMFRHEVKDIDGVDIHFWKDEHDPVALLASHLADRSRVGIDKYWPSHFLIALMKHKNTVEWFSASPVIDELRQIKTAAELDTLRESARIADKVMERAASIQHFPLTETELAELLRQSFKTEGVPQFSFSPIVGFGENSAVPHHHTSDRRSGEGHAVLIDMGGRYREYCSDMTRTYYLGEPDARFKEVYGIVLEAQQAAIAKVKPGIPAQEIDQAARDVIARAGYGEQFTHRTGHGLGIEIHEEPYITASNPQLLQAGMVFSIEPGIYLPGQFGVRIEDIVVVTEDGVEVLNQASKEISIK